MTFQMNRCSKRGQRQTADNIETMGIVSYQHTFSSDAVSDFRAMVRDNSNDFNSNADSTPMEVFQHNWFREGYFKGDGHRRSRASTNGNLGSNPTTPF